MTKLRSHVLAAVVAAVGSVLLLGVAWLAHAALSMPMIDDDD